MIGKDKTICMNGACQGKVEDSICLRCNLKQTNEITIKLTEKQAKLLYKYDYKILDDLCSCGLVEGEPDLYTEFEGLFMEMKNQVEDLK